VVPAGDTGDVTTTAVTWDGYVTMHRGGSGVCGAPALSWSRHSR